MDTTTPAERPSDPSRLRPTRGTGGPAPAGTSGTPGAVEVRRSSRRRRTVSAYRDGDRTVVLLPARMSRAEESHWVEVMMQRLAARERRRRPSDDDLSDRARALSERYLGGRAVPTSVRWVSNQTGRWGSCTVVDRTIRLSDRLRVMPGYVQDYVLLHELVHLLVPSHGPAFWAELAAYPQTDRARGYLDGWSTALSAERAAGSQRGAEPDEVDGLDEVDELDEVDGIDDVDDLDEVEPAQEPGQGYLFAQA